MNKTLGRNLPNWQKNILRQEYIFKVRCDAREKSTALNERFKDVTRYFRDKDLKRASQGSRTLDKYSSEPWVKELMPNVCISVDW